MRPVDIENMITLARSPRAPAMICQAGYVFVNTETISRHPDLVNQLHQRVQNNLLKMLDSCSGDGVDVYSIIAPPEPAGRIRRQDLSNLFQLSK